MPTRPRSRGCTTRRSGLRLATYTYKPEVADPGVTHLGFVIEDNPDSQAVSGARGRVDMYGYVSMVVASMQVQEREIVAEGGASRCRAQGSCFVQGWAQVAQWVLGWKDCAMGRKD